MIFRAISLVLAAAVFGFSSAQSACAAATQPSLETSAYFRLIWGLLVVLGIMLVIYAGLKKRFSLFSVGSQAQIKVIEMKPLQPKKSLCIVEIHGKQYLLGLGGDQISLLTEISQPTTASFEQALQASTQHTTRP